MRVLAGFGCTTHNHPSLTSPNPRPGINRRMDEPPFPGLRQMISRYRIVERVGSGGWFIKLKTLEPTVLLVSEFLTEI